MSSEAEALCIGETMVLLASSTGESLTDAAGLDMYVAGAESNVAVGMAHLGHSVGWFGRVGRDPLGGRVRRALAQRDVDVSMVVEDGERPTGLYLKDVSVPGTPVYYYRRGSAASAMSIEDLSALKLSQRRLCHLSGITPALSPSCDALLTALVQERSAGGPLVSFDVNYRAALWDRQTAAPRLLELAAAADIVIVGRDEAETLWGTTGPETVRDLLPGVPQLIVKDDDKGATAYVGTTHTFVPALQVEVVEPVGAGDAFAAGYLSSLLDGGSTEAGLRLGHLMAGYTLTHVSDLPPWPDPARLLAAGRRGKKHWDSLRSRLLGADVADAEIAP